MCYIKIYLKTVKTHTHTHIIVIARNGVIKNLAIGMGFLLILSVFHAFLGFITGTDSFWGL